MVYFFYHRCCSNYCCTFCCICCDILSSAIVKKSLRKTESSPDVQDVNQDPIYEEVDLKNWAQNHYESPEGIANYDYSIMLS